MPSVPPEENQILPEGIPSIGILSRDSEQDFIPPDVVFTPAASSAPASLS